MTPGTLALGLFVVGGLWYLFTATLRQPWLPPKVEQHFDAATNRRVTACRLRPLHRRLKRRCKSILRSTGATLEGGTITLQQPPGDGVEPLTEPAAADERARVMLAALAVRDGPRSGMKRALQLAAPRRPHEDRYSYRGALARCLFETQPQDPGVRKLARGYRDDPDAVTSFAAARLLRDRRWADSLREPLARAALAGKAEALEPLRQTDPDALLDVLVRLLSHDENDLQQQACQWLGRFGTLEHIEPLTAVADAIFEAPRVKRAARSAIETIQAHAGGGGPQGGLSMVEDTADAGALSLPDEGQLELVEE